MFTVRRLYILAASFIGLLLFAQGSEQLLGIVLLLLSQDPEYAIGGDWWRETLSIGLALVVVGTPLWVGHWIWAQRLARGGTEEGSALRALYFLAVLGVTLIATAGAAESILFVPFARVAGGSIGAVAALDSLPTLLIYGLIWLYHIRQRPAHQIQSGAAATITRWYWYTATFASVGIVATSVIPLLSSLLEQLVGSDPVDAGWWQLSVANNIAWILVGCVGWAFHWTVTQRQISDAQSPELRSALRKVFLYAMVGSGALGALLAVGRILYLGLLSLLGAVTEQLQFIDDLTWVLPTALVAATAWFYHRHMLQRDRNLVAEQPRQAAIRRIYSYLLSAVGIGLLAAGIFGLLRLVIGVLTGRAETLDLPENFLQEQLSLYVTLLLVGLFAWVWYWRQVQHHLERDESGAERGSLVRRIYLYLVSSASVIAGIVAIGTLLYEGMRSVLGISGANDFIDALNINLSVGLIALTVLAYHVRFLRREHRPSQAEHEQQVTHEEAPPGLAEPTTATGAHTLVVALTGGDLETARSTIAGSGLPAGTQQTVFESMLTPEEIRRRLENEGHKSE